MYWIFCAYLKSFWVEKIRCEKNYFCTQIIRKDLLLLDRNKPTTKELNSIIAEYTACKHTPDILWWKPAESVKIEMMKYSYK